MTVTDSPTTPAAPSDAALEVRLKAAYEVEVRVDLEAEMRTLGERPNRLEQYRSLSLSDAGYTHEWERPLAWLVDAFGEASLSFDMPVSGVTSERIEERDFMEVDVARRPETHRFIEWSREQFDALAARWPFLLDVLIANDGEDDAERQERLAALALRPGPLDQPLPLD